MCNGFALRSRALVLITVFGLLVSGLGTLVAVAAPTAVSAYSAGTKLINQDTYAWGTVSGAPSAQVSTEVLVNGQWLRSQTGKAVNGQYTLKLTYGASTPGVYRFRVKATDGGVSKYSAQFTLTRVRLSVTATSAGWKRINQDTYAWGNVVGDPSAKVTTEALVNGRWSRSRTGQATNGSYALNLSYGAGLVGVHQFRVKAESGGQVAYSSPITIRRTAPQLVVVSAETAGVKPIYQTTYVWGNVIGATSGRVSTEVQINGKWSKSQVGTIQNGKYTLPLTYGASTTGSYRFRVKVEANARVAYSSAFSLARSKNPVSVTANTDGSKPVNQTAFISGKVTGAKASEVRAEVLRNGLWEDVNTGYLESDGTYRIFLSTTTEEVTPGNYSFRIRATFKRAVSGFDGVLFSSPARLRRTEANTISVTAYPWLPEVQVGESAFAPAYFSGFVRGTGRAEVWAEYLAITVSPYGPLTALWVIDPGSRVTSTNGTYTLPVSFRSHQPGNFTVRIKAKAGTKTAQTSTITTRRTNNNPSGMVLEADTIPNQDDPSLIAFWGNLVTRPNGVGFPTITLERQTGFAWQEDTLSSSRIPGTNRVLLKHDRYLEEKKYLGGASLHRLKARAANGTVAYSRPLDLTMTNRLAEASGAINTGFQMAPGNTLFVLSDPRPFSPQNPNFHGDSAGQTPDGSCPYEKHVKLDVYQGNGSTQSQSSAKLDALLQPFTGSNQTLVREFIRTAPNLTPAPSSSALVPGESRTYEVAYGITAGDPPSYLCATIRWSLDSNDPLAVYKNSTACTKLQ